MAPHWRRLPICASAGSGQARRGDEVLLVKAPSVTPAQEHGGRRLLQPLTRPATAALPDSTEPRWVIIRSITLREHIMERHLPLLMLASGRHGGAVVFTIGVGVVLLIAIYLFARGRR